MLLMFQQASAGLGTSASWGLGAATPSARIAAWGSERCLVQSVDL